MGTNNTSTKANCLDETMAEQPTNGENGGETHENQSNQNGQGYRCPFPQCNKGIVRLYTLKTHLLKIKGGGGDEIHLQGHPAWTVAQERGYLDINTGPQNLTEAEKKERKKLNSRKYRANHKEDLGRARRDNSKNLRVC